MFATDSLGEIDFELEFNLPKEISDNQDLIRLKVHHVEVPTVEIPACPLGYRPISIRMPGEIHCIERYKYIKDVLLFINKWVNSIYCPCDKLNSSRSNQFVEAKLYAYKNDHSLFKKWRLVEFYPLFNPNVEYFFFSDNVVELLFKFFSDNVVELIFKFENAIELKT